MSWGTRALSFAIVAALWGCGAKDGTSAEPAPAPSPSSSSAPAAGAASTATSGTPAPSSSSPSSSGDAGAPSASCGSKSGAPGDHDLSLSVGGVARTAHLHVPSSYDASKPAMLVVNFHGLYMDASGEAWLTKMNAASDARGFLVVYPQGVDNSFNAGGCCGTALSQNVDDVAFARTLVQTIEHDYCVDDHRVFATGMSNGGHMSYRVACDAADVFAAVAPVAGVLVMSDAACKPSRPVPVLHFHGTSDPIVAYSGGQMRSAPGSIDALKAKYGCASAQGATAYQKGDATCVTFPGCTADLELCTIDGGGHTWPGGNSLPFGKTSTDIDATATMLDFFEKHPK